MELFTERNDRGGRNVYHRNDGHRVTTVTFDNTDAGQVAYHAYVYGVARLTSDTLYDVDREQYVVASLFDLVKGG